MTFVEFITPLKLAPHRVKVLATMYFLHRYQGMDSMRTSEIKSLLTSARLPNAKSIDVPTVLNRAGHFVDSPGSDGTRRLWQLTGSGHAEVRRLLDLPEAEPEVEHDVSLLTKLVATIPDPDARGFVEEAVTCLRVGALRAAVVFLWSGAVRTLHQAAWTHGSKNVTDAVQKHDPKARPITKIDDFANVKDAVTLRALQDLGVLDKGQKATLEEALGLRNRCGHPTKYSPGEKKVSSFIEDVLGIVFR